MGQSDDSRSLEKKRGHCHCEPSRVYNTVRRGSNQNVEGTHRPFTVTDEILFSWNFSYDTQHYEVDWKRDPEVRDLG